MYYLKKNLFLLFSVATLLTRRFLSPWLFPDFSFKISSQGQQFFKQLQVLHGFTNKVFIESLNKRLRI